MTKFKGPYALKILCWLLIIGSCCLELCFLLLILSNDVETNPGPKPMSGICRLCLSENVVEKPCYLLIFFITNYSRAIGSTFMPYELGTFLVACTRLHKSPCRSVCRSVGPSVCRSVGRSVPLCFFLHFLAF